MSKAASDTFGKKVSTSVTASLITAVVIGVVTYWWRPVSTHVSSGWDWLTDPTSVSRLWLGVLWLVFVAVVFGIGALAFASLLARHEQSFRDYKEDQLFNLLWRWDWTSGGSISSLAAFCPGCNRLMRYHEDPHGYPPRICVHFECQACQHPTTFDGPLDEVEKKVRIEIHHRIDTGAWQNTLKRTALPVR